VERIDSSEVDLDEVSAEAGAQVVLLLSPPLA